MGEWAVRGPKPNLSNIKFESPFSEFSAIENTDNHGFRNQDRDYNKSNLYFVGDSFAWGYGVNREQSFYGIIESETKQPVITLGVSGYGFMQYEILFRDWVAKYKPKTAVLCVFQNDLTRQRPPKNLFTAPDGKYPTLYWYKKTFGYQFLSRLNRNYAYKKTRNNLTLVGINNKYNNFDKIKSKDILEFHDLNYLDSDAHIDVEKSLSRIIDISNENQFQLFIFLIPSKESANIKEYTALFKHSAPVLDVEEKGYERLCQIAHERNINCVNLTTYFRKKSEKEKLYFDIDGHWNVAGHKLASQLILDTLNGHKE